MSETRTMAPRLAPNVTVIQPLFERIRQDLKEDVRHQKLRVAAYARVSTEQDEQESKSLPPALPVVYRSPSGAFCGSAYRRGLATY